MRQAAIAGRPPAGCIRLSRLLDGRSVVGGEANFIEDMRDNGTAIGVYSRGDKATAFVPTGRIIVSVGEARTLDSSCDAFMELGYRVVKASTVAPNAGWLSHRSGVIAEALLGCERLRRLDFVSIVEPEMLRAVS